MGLFKKRGARGHTIDEIVNGESADNVIINETQEEEESEAKVEEREEITNDREPYVVENKLGYFGLSKDETEAWVLTMARVWYILASLCWFIVGAVTFAPVIFVTEKIDVVFRNKSKSLLISIILYSVTIAVILFCIIR